MTDYYEILGVSKADATDESIKKAYRQLASKHHPDKFQDAEKPAAEAKFKAIKEAYEALETAEKRQEYNNPRRRQFNPNDAQSMHEEILRAFRAAHDQQQRNAVPFVRLNISLERAFNGTIVPLNLFGRSIAYNVRPGMPQGVAYVDEVPVEDKTRQIQVQLQIDESTFRFRRPGTEDGLNFNGDLETDIEIDALDILAGGFVIAEDFLGKKLQVRVPSGFDPRHRLKIAGHGYSHWRGDKVGSRGDLYLCVLPKFKSVAELDPDKVEALYFATRKAPKIDVSA